MDNQLISMCQTYFQLSKVALIIDWLKLLDVPKFS